MDCFRGTKTYAKKSSAQRGDSPSESTEPRRIIRTCAKVFRSSVSIPVGNPLFITAWMPSPSHPSVYRREPDAFGHYAECVPPRLMCQCGTVLQNTSSVYPRIGPAHDERAAYQNCNALSFATMDVSVCHYGCLGQTHLTTRKPTAPSVRCHRFHAVMFGVRSGVQEVACPAIVTSIDEACGKLRQGNF